jgi:hypothetical protein
VKGARQPKTQSAPCKQPGQIRKQDKNGKWVCRSAAGRRIAVAVTRNTPCPKPGHVRKQDKDGKWVCRSAAGRVAVTGNTPCAPGKVRALVPVKSKYGFTEDKWRCVTKPAISTSTAIAVADTTDLVHAASGKMGSGTLKMNALHKTKHKRKRTPGYTPPRRSARLSKRG